MKAEIADPRPTTLNAALIAARRALRGTVQKEGYNRDQRYSFVGHEQVLMSGARDALLAEGLVLEQRSVEYVGELVAESRSGRRTIWHWTGTYALVHESGEERTYRFSATTQPNDKAAFVASTALDRTAYLRLLALTGSEEENPEANVHDETREQSRRYEARQAPQERREAPRLPPSNVVRLPARQEAPRAPEDHPDWGGTLQGLQGQMRQNRTPAELMTWWATMVTSMPHATDKVFRAEAWRMFGRYCESLGHNFDRMKPAIDKRVAEAKAAKKGGA